MPPLKAVTLNTLSNQKTIEHLLEDTLYEILGIKERLSVPDTGYTRGTPGYFYNSLARDVSAKITEVGKELGDRSFSNFSFYKTKLTAEIIEEIWSEISSLLVEQIETLFRSNAHKIPGLEELLKETSFLPGRQAPFKIWDDEYKDYCERERKHILGKMESINDANEFIAKFRNNFFEYFKREYGVFNEPTGEISAGFKLH